MFVAFLDACVLLPVALADTLLRAAEHGLFRPSWSREVLDEVRRAFLAVRQDLDPSRIDVRLRAMDDTFPDASTAPTSSADDRLGLPDPKDEHVVQSARAARADIIVTANLRDFPADRLGPPGLAAVGPDDFLLDQLDLSPETMLAVVCEQAAAARKPSRSVADVLLALGRAGAPGLAGRVRSLLETDR